MKKRVLPLILVVTMVAGIFTGCGGSSEDQAQATEQAVAETTAEATAATNTTPEDLSGTIVIGGWPAGDEALKAIEPGFKELYPNVTIEYNFMQTEDYEKFLQTTVAAGSGAPDVCMIEQGMAGRFKDSGGFENLLDDPYNAEQYKDQFVEYQWNLALSSDQSKLVGLVWDIGPATTFYRKDIFAEVGLPTEPAEVEALMSTWDGYLEVAEKVYVPNERWLVPNAFYLYYWNYMNRDFYNEDLELQLDKPGAKEALEAAIIMRQNGWDAQMKDMWSNEAQAGIASGAIVTATAGCWYGGFIKTWLAPETSGKWGVCRLPGGIADSNWGGSYLSIPTQSENKEAAWAFIQYALTNPTSQNAMFTKVDYFPGYMPAWDDPMYQEADPFFDNQQTRALWVDISKNIQPTFSTPMDGKTEDVINNTVNAGLNEGKTADEIIASIEEQVMKETKQEREQFEKTLDRAAK